MEPIYGIIKALGINNTLWVQLGIFATTYVYLRYVVFRPYFAAFEVRQSQTAGNTEKAEEIKRETLEIELRYQNKARELNSQIKDIFEQSKADLNKEQEKIYAEARETARKEIETARAKIKDEYNRAREELIKKTPELSEAIAQKLLGEEARQ